MDKSCTRTGHGAKVDLATETASEACTDGNRALVVPLGMFAQFILSRAVKNEAKVDLASCFPHWRVSDCSRIPQTHQYTY